MNCKCGSCLLCLLDNYIDSWMTEVHLSFPAEEYICISADLLNLISVWAYDVNKMDDCDDDCLSYDFVHIY